MLKQTSSCLYIVWATRNQIVGEPLTDVGRRSLLFFLQILSCCSTAAIDNKHNVISQLAAIEDIIKHDITPPRTVYVALGHDEEINGWSGAAHIARYLKETQIQFEYIFDEGSMMVSGAVPMIKTNVAMISTSEKGYVN